MPACRLHEGRCTHTCPASRAQWCHRCSVTDAARSASDSHQGASRCCAAHSGLSPLSPLWQRAGEKLVRAYGSRRGRSRLHPKTPCL